MTPLLAVFNDDNSNVTVNLWTVLLVLAIIALILFIVRGRRRF